MQQQHNKKLIKKKPHNKKSKSETKMQTMHARHDVIG